MLKITKDWLYGEYCNNKKTITDISKLCDVERHTISKYLDLFGIEKRKVNISKDWIYNEYIIKKKPISKISKENGWDKTTIPKYLKKYNIPLRNPSERNLISLSNHIDLSNKALEFIYGELLGDGSLQWGNGKHSARIGYGSKYKEYLVWLSEQLNGFGIKQSGNLNLKSKGFSKNDSYQYTSISYIELSKIRQYFYPLDIKIIPKDLKLTPICVRQWYIGDGSICKSKSKLNGKCYNKIRFYTDGFVKSDVEFLSNLLNGELSIKSIVTKRKSIYNEKTSYNYIIDINKIQDQITFLNYIGDCPKQISSIYGYKWNLC